MGISNYLSYLPDESLPLGKYLDGEIEISTDAGVISSVVESRSLKERSISFIDQDLKTSFSNTGIVFEDEYILVVRDPVIFKNGKAGSYLRILERPSLTGKAGVVILPVKDGLIYFNRIFRHATRQWELELPRGYREDGHSLEETVEIELLQEVGYGVKSITSLGEVHPNTGLLVGSVQAYTVQLIDGTPKTALEDGESISDTLILTLDEVNNKILKGEIRDGFTLATLYLAQVRNIF